MPAPTVTGEPPLPPHAMLSTARAADYLGVSERTLQDWRIRGPEGPRYFKPSANRVRYRVADLDAFIAQRSYRHAGEEIAASIIRP